jgi:small subunit ribosomal protein S16
MATKIRLQRKGRKGYAFYSIVIADVNAPRDGRFIEKIGTYDPNLNPSKVDLNFDRALYWVECGAQPTDTVRNILSHEGVYLMKHLRGGVKKGAFDEAAAQTKFDAWKKAKVEKTDKFVASLNEAKKAAKAARLEAEKKVNAEIAKKVAEKKAAAEAAKAEALKQAAEEAAAEAAAQNAPIDAPEAPEAEAPVEETPAEA